MIRRAIQLALAGAVILGPPTAAAAEKSGDAWRYTDERGVVHFTDNVGTVRGRHRESLERVEIQSPAPPTPKARAAAKSAAGRDAAASSGDAVSPMVARIAESAGGNGGFSPEDIEKLEVWMNTWGLAYLASGAPWGIVIFAVGFHALRRRRWLWAAGAVVFWPIGIPLYLLLRYDTLGMPARAAMLAVWTLPFIVGGLALRQAAILFSG